MITVFTRPGCAYCPTAKKYIGEILKVDYVEKPAEGSEYMKLAKDYGYNVPLIYNGTQAVMGWNPAKIKELVV